jgi:hypothetical protein
MGLFCFRKLAALPTMPNGFVGRSRINRDSVRISRGRKHGIAGRFAESESDRLWSIIG